MNKKKILHIAVIFFGIIMISIPAFHQNIWFDESYSIALAKHNFMDIWNITGHDVHPALYYWMIHIVYLIFGNSIIAFRLFSLSAIAILGILGYTHIKKDFGEKTGIIFSFLTFFLPIIGIYSREIRMYSWSCLIVTLMGIYAYRFYKKIKDKGNDIYKELILFGIFSMCSCYIHYYALVTAGLVNLYLLIYLIKNKKDAKKKLIIFLCLAGIQIILYTPWLIYFVGQLNYVDKNFWIIINPINTTIEILSFQFKMQIYNEFLINLETVISVIVAISVDVYLFYKAIQLRKENKNIKPLLLSFSIYLGIILIVAIISIVSPILLPRYLFVITGFYIFGMAFLISKEKKKWITIAIIAIITGMSLVNTVKSALINYDESNIKQIEYLKEKIKDEDIIIYKDYAIGGVISVFFKDNKQYYYNSENWNIEEPYKAYKPCMEIIYNCNDILKDYHGRIWIVDLNDKDLYNEIPKEKMHIVEGPIEFKTKYQNYIYNIMLLEKE